MSARLRHRPRAELTGEAMARLRKAYLDNEVTVASISRRFGIACKTLTNLAEREGWPLRKKTREQRAGHDDSGRA